MQKVLALLAVPIVIAGFAIATPPKQAVRLTVVQITDVYTLEYFPHLKKLIEETRAANPNTISVLTGDFLAPYLLSSVDKGHGMMRMINETPIDFLSWGNHEADIAHSEVCNHIRNYKGTWLNSNMLDHEAMEYQREYAVVECASADGSQTRRIGLCAVRVCQDGNNILPSVPLIQSRGQCMRRC